MRLIVRSNDNIGLFPSNVPHDFKIQLLHTLYLKGTWSIALREFTTTSWSGENLPDDVYIYSNLCDDTIVGNVEEPLLKRVYLGEHAKTNHIFWDPVYVPVRLGQVEQVRMYIKDKSGNPASFLDGTVTCELHLKSSD